MKQQTSHFFPPVPVRILKNQIGKRYINKKIQAVQLKLCENVKIKILSSALAV